MADELNNHIAMCGLDCAKCRAFIATKNNDDAMRQKTADEWVARKKAKGIEAIISPKDINCYGCLSLGPLYDKCQRCEIRKCGQVKSLTDCNQCPDYKCKKLAEFQKSLW